jgi:hypothetical protein
MRQASPENDAYQRVCNCIKMGHAYAVSAYLFWGSISDLLEAAGRRASAIADWPLHSLVVPYALSL